MPRPKKNYETIFAAKQRDTAKRHAIDTLREGTKLSTPIEDFIAGLQSANGVKAAMKGLTLGDVFGEVLDPEEPGTPATRRKTAKGPRKKTTRKKKVARKTKKGTRGGRRPSETVAKRLDLIAAILAKHDDWMKTSEVLTLASKNRALFGEVDAVRMGAYLGRLVDERPARAKKKGQRGASKYRAAAAAAKTGKPTGKKTSSKKRKATNKKAGGRKKAAKRTSAQSRSKKAEASDAG